MQETKVTIRSGPALGRVLNEHIGISPNLVTYRRNQGNFLIEFFEKSPFEGVEPVNKTVDLIKARISGLRILDAVNCHAYWFDNRIYRAVITAAIDEKTITVEKESEDECQRPNLNSSLIDQHPTQYEETLLELSGDPSCCRTLKILGWSSCFPLCRSGLPHPLPNTE